MNDVKIEDTDTKNIFSGCSTSTFLPLRLKITFFKDLSILVRIFRHHPLLIGIVLVDRVFIRIKITLLLLLVDRVYHSTLHHEQSIVINEMFHRYHHSQWGYRRQNGWPRIIRICKALWHEPRRVRVGPTRWEDVWVSWDSDWLLFLLFAIYSAVGVFVGTACHV